jgi:hypothetical protein
MTVKVGQFVAKGSVGVQAVTGIGFQPQAIIFYGRLKTDSTLSSGLDVGWGVASSTAASNQFTVCGSSLDGIYYSSNLRYQSDIYCYSNMDTGGRSYERARLQSFDSNGFTIYWTSCTSAFLVNYIAFGDLTGAKVGNFSTTTGLQSVTGVGFSPDIVLFFGDNYATLDAVTSNLMLSLGAAKSSTEKWGLSLFSEYSALPTDTERLLRTDKNFFVVSNGYYTAETDLHSMDADGFTVDNNLSGGIKVGYLALKGGSHKLSSFLKTTASATASQSITGIGFQPNLVVLAGVDNDASTAIATDNSIGFGAASSTADSYAIAAFDMNGVNFSDTQDYQQSKAITFVNNTAEVAGATLTSFDADGFTISWTTNNTSAHAIAYWASRLIPTYTTTHTTDASLVWGQSSHINDAVLISTKPIAIDSIVTVLGDAVPVGNKLVWAHTVSHPGELLTVSLATMGFYYATDVAYAGTPLTRSPYITGVGGRRAELWYAFNATTGTNNITATFSGRTATFVAANSIGRIGVKALGSTATAAGTASPATVDVTSSVGSVIQDVLCYGTAGTDFPIMGDGQSQRWISSYSGIPVGAGSDKPSTSSSTTMSWTITPVASGWALAAIELIPATYTQSHTTDTRLLYRGVRSHTTDALALSIGQYTAQYPQTWLSWFGQNEDTNLSGSQQPYVTKPYFPRYIGIGIGTTTATSYRDMSGLVTEIDRVPAVGFISNDVAELHGIIDPDQDNTVIRELGIFTDDAKSIVLSTCEVTTGWTSASILTADNMEMKEGSACLQSDGGGSMRFRNASLSGGDGWKSSKTYLQFWLHVRIGEVSSIIVQLSSSILDGIDEYEWIIDPSTLSYGWNYMSLKVTDATTNGSPDINNIKRFMLSAVN